MPRFDISSDKGAAFIQKTLKLVMQHLNVKQRFDQQNLCNTKLNCVDALPLALMSYPMQANRMAHLTQHEMLTGQPMTSPTFRGPHKGLPFAQL